MNKLNIKLLVMLLAMSNFAFAQLPLTSPDDEEQCLPLETRFEWEQQPNNPRYGLQITKIQGDYNNPVVDESGLTSNFVDVILTEHSQTFYWRASASYSNTFFNSEERMFVTQRSGTNLGLPADEATCSPETTTFSWQALENIKSYNIEVSETENFNNIVVSDNSGTSTSIELELPKGFTNYYWRVNAAYTSNGENCVTEWSNVHQLRSSVYPPVLQNPANNETGISFQPTLNWQSANGANLYSFQLSTTNTFGAADLLYDESGISEFQQTVDLDDTKFDTDYFWRVQSLESATSSCISEWSEVFKFTTRLESTTLTSPEDLSQCVELDNTTFSWGQIGSSNTFQIQLDDDNDFSDPEIDISDIDDTSIDLTLPDDNTVYYWRVRANSGGNTSEWSEVFELLSGIFSPTPDLPEDGASDQFIALDIEWDNRSNFSNQNIQISRTNNFDDIVIDESGLNENEYFAVLPDYGQTYYWRVSSTLGNCESGWSDVSSFTTYEGSPSLVYPEDQEINLPLQIFFEWDEVDFAESYDIQLSLTDDFSIIEKARFDVDGTVVWITELKEKETYYWRVRSVNQYSKSPWSDPISFETGLQDANKPTTIYPPNNSEMIPVEALFLWSESENAQAYDLQISLENDFEDLSLEEESITSTSFNVSGLDNYEEYFWRVRGKNQTTTSPWSNPARFRTIAPEITGSATLSRPENGATDLGTKEVEFVWGAIDNTTDVDGGYQIQIATSQGFEESEMVINVRNVFRVDPLISNLQPLATHFWRVRGWNEAGDGPWSEVFEFTTLDPSSVNDITIKQVDIYPNPTSDDINVSFNLETAGRLEINIFDISGNNVAKIDKGFISAGENNIKVDELNLNSGKYLIMLKVGNSVVTYSFTVAK
jgi:hypothetical protein